MALSGFLFASANLLAAETAETFSDAFKLGDFNFDLRWRAEYVDQVPFQHAAFGIPLRLRFNYGTASWKGFSAFAEVDYIYGFDIDTYNQGGGNTPENADYPVIADPDGGDLNQAFLQWQSQTGNRFRAGRQRIIYDNQRFIGNVGWRQNEQTYDALSFQRQNLGEWELQAAYVDRVLRIFGDDVPAGKQDMETWLVNVSRKIGTAGKLVGYYYDIENEDQPTFSNRTWGLRFTGSQEAGATKIGYGAEFANQRDNSNSPVNFNSDYWRLDLSVEFDLITIYGGYESLGGSDTEPGQAFRTPLATLHAFNGWADKFLATPQAGLVDVFAGIKFKLGGWSWNALYHDFSAESGSGSFGDEVDAVISRKIGERYSILFKGAWFSSSSPAYGDTSKIWVMWTAGF